MQRSKTKMKTDDTKNETPMTAAEAENHQRPKDAPVTEDVTITDVPKQEDLTSPTTKSETKKQTVTARKKASKAQRQAKVAVTTTAKTEFDGAKTVDELVEKYNEMVLTGVDFGLACKTVKTFGEVKTGVLACERLHAQIQKARAQTEGNDAQTKKEQKMAKKAKKTTAKKAVKKTAKKTKGGAAKRSVNRASMPSDAVYTAKKGFKNPFREKSGKYARVEKVQSLSGSTIAEMKKKGVKGGTIGWCLKNGAGSVKGGAAA